jgi:hypothetical protein
MRTGQGRIRVLHVMNVATVMQLANLIIFELHGSNFDASRPLRRRHWSSLDWMFYRAVVLQQYSK